MDSLSGIVDEQLWLNPHRLVPALQRHLILFESELRNPANDDVRENFETVFDRISDPSGVVSVTQADVSLGV